ncbi:hypothetical protein ACXHX3_19350, partial [Bacillus velezensis]
RPGEEWLHFSRVASLSVYMAKEVVDELFITETAALVLDLIDAKLEKSERMKAGEVTERQAAVNNAADSIQEKKDIITRMSYRNS